MYFIRVFPKLYRAGNDVDKGHYAEDMSNIDLNVATVVKSFLISVCQQWLGEDPLFPTFADLVNRVVVRLTTDWFRSDSQFSYLMWKHQHN